MRQSAAVRAANRYTRVALPHPDEVLDALRTLRVLVGGIVRLTVPVITKKQVDTTTKRLNGEIERLQADGTARIVLTVGGAYDSWIQLCPNPIETAPKAISGLAYKLRVDTIGDLVPAEHLLEYYPVFRDAARHRDNPHARPQHPDRCLTGVRARSGVSSARFTTLSP